jgi:hypothetical protein
MKYLFSFIAFFICLQFFSVCSYTQQYEDILYLKNGSIIHGIIIEQVIGESVKIKTKDGNYFVFKMDEIEKMTKEEIIIKKDETKKIESDSIKTKVIKSSLKSDTNKTKKKELIANNSVTIQPIGLLTLLSNIEYDRALSKNFSTGLKISFMTFFLRNAISFEGNPVDVENAETIRGSLSAWGIGSHIRYYPGDRATEGFFLGLAFERLAFSGDEVNGDITKTTINHKLNIIRLEFEIGSRSKLSSGKGGLTIQWSLGAGVGFGNGWFGNKGSEDESKTIPVGSFGFGLGYSF